MPTYGYEHTGKACKLGKVFEVEQSIKDDPLKLCPRCKGPVKRLIYAPAISVPRSNSKLKETGFTKLVRRDKGVYENVTARDGDDKVMDFSGLGKPGSKK